MQLKLGGYSRYIVVSRVHYAEPIISVTAVEYRHSSRVPLCIVIGCRSTCRRYYKECFVRIVVLPAHIYTCWGSMVSDWAPDCMKGLEHLLNRPAAPAVATSTLNG